MVLAVIILKALQLMNTRFIKYGLLALCFVFFSRAVVFAQNVVDSSYVFSGYTDRLAMFTKMPVANKSIIFLGNSLTEAGRWKDIAPELPILNRGISGDNSFGLYARLDEVVRHHPKKIFLMIGVNDLKRGTPTSYIIKNYERIVAKIIKESPQTKIYLNSILPINKSKLIESFKAVNNDDINILNNALKDISAKHKNVEFVDLYPVIADEKGELRKELTPDGIHLEMFAYVDVVNYLKKIKAL